MWARWTFRLSCMRPRERAIPSAAFVLVALLFSPLALANDMSREEVAVRTAYARLSYAAELRVVAQDATNAPGSAHGSKVELKAQIANLTPRFEIDNMVIGSLSAIADQPWERFANRPDGDLVDVGASRLSWGFTGTDGIVTKKSMFYVMTGWRNQAFGESWDGISVAQAVGDQQKLRQESYDRYAHYRVHVTLDGRGRTYNAIFLFGKDAKGNEVVHIVDHIMGIGSLDLVLGRSLYPEVLLETYYREAPEIADWVSASTVMNQTPTRDVFCIPSGCGLPMNHVRKSLAIPIDPRSRELRAKPRAPGSRPIHTATPVML